MRVSAPSSCSGVVFVRCLVAIGRTRARSTPETAMNATSCSAVAPPSRATAIPPSAPPANISRTRSRLITSPAAKSPAAISQSNHGAMSGVSQNPCRVVDLRTLRRADLRLGRGTPVLRPGERASRRSLAGCTTSPRAASPSGRQPGSPVAAPTTRRWTRCWVTPPTASPDLPGTDEAVPLGWALTALRGLGERRFRLVLPVAGDIRGLPRVPGLAALALESGQAAVGAHLALVPEPLGPEVVQWTPFPLAGAPPVAPVPEGNLRAVSGALDLAIGDTARALAGLDVARWNPEVPTLLAGLARTVGAPGLPADHDSLALSVLGRAERLAKVLDLAMADAPGAAVNHAQAAARDDALRPLAQAVREATVAAFNWVPRG